MKDNKHQFAFFAPFLPDQISIGMRYTVTDKDLVHRITHVLRLELGSLLTFFTTTKIYSCVLQSYDKIRVHIIIEQEHPLIPLQPSITLLLPFLKKEALEAAVYTATLMGIQNIQVVTTEKSLQGKLKEHECERLQRIIVAAAEQSKQFVLPIIEQPIPLVKAFENLSSSSIKLYADPTGESLHSLLIRESKQTSIVICTGPEGDMTEVEKELLQEAGFRLCRLTPSILKSEHALMVFAGIVRSALH